MTRNLASGSAAPTAGPVLRLRPNSALVLDVRQSSEFAAGHLPGARSVELGNVREEVAGRRGSGVGREQSVGMCGHGERAQTGASLLPREGRRDLAVAVGCPQDWATTHGAARETGP